MALRLLTCCLLAALTCAGALGASSGTAIVPPKVEQPDEFSHLIGYFDISASVDVSELFVEEPLVLKVTILSKAPGLHQPDYLPQRKNLKIFPATVEKDFYVGGLPEKDRHDAERNRWEFYYQLQPRHEGVTKFPPLRLWFYNPQAPLEQQRYQVSFSRSIPLKVKARPQVLIAPERFYQLATGPGVLRRDEASPLDWLPLTLALAVPPAVCLVAHRLWRHLNPGVAGLQRRRQSQAARQALRELRRLHDDANGSGSGQLLTRYLQTRLDLPADEPTPQETALHLRRIGLSEPLVRRVAEFFTAVHRLRFAPLPARDDFEPRASGVRLVLAIEEEVA